MNILANIVSPKAKIIVLSAAFCLLVSLIFYGLHDILKKQSRVAVALRINSEEALQELNATIVYMNKNHSLFEKIIDKGAFNPLTRMEAVSLLEEVKQKSRLNTLTYEFSQTDMAYKSRNTDEILKQIMNTNVFLRFGVFTDIDAFKMLNFLDDLQGVVVLRSLVLYREKELTDDVLSSVAKGQRQDLVVGEARFSWLTLAKTPSFISQIMQRK